MTCRECQERLFAARRTSDVSQGAEDHLGRCAACGDFARALSDVSGHLCRWRLPTGTTEGARAALVARLSAPRRPLVTPLDRPLLPGLLGAAAAVLGIAAAPGWARGVLFIWLVLAGLTTLMVLLQCAWRSAPRGERERWIPRATD